MPFEKMEILKGNALFVLKNLFPLNIFEIASVWGMYGRAFASALDAGDFTFHYPGSKQYGPYWGISHRMRNSLKKTLLMEGLVDEINEIVRGKKVKSLKINEKGLSYLTQLLHRGMRLKGGKKMKESMRYDMYLFDREPLRAKK